MSVRARLMAFPTCRRDEINTVSDFFNEKEEIGLFEGTQIIDQKSAAFTIASR